MRRQYYKQKTALKVQNRMKPDMHDSFSLIKPICDSVMQAPTTEKLTSFLTRLSEIKDDVLEEMHLYILFPVVTHLRSDNFKYKYELQRQMVDTMKTVVEKVSINSTEIFFKYHTCLLNLIYDKTKPGIVADIPEELKHSLMECFSLLMLKMEPAARAELFKMYVPLLAQTVFICVHVAKQDKLRALRLSAINSVLAYTATHPQLTKNYQIVDKNLERAACDFVSGVLPGVLAALQDVAADVDNPGHAVVTAAVNATHRVVCLVMSDRMQPKRDSLRAEDFARLVRERAPTDPQVASKLREIPKKTPEWFKMAGAKLRAVSRGLAALQAHEHAAVRRELALYCSRVLFECSRTMQPSIGIALDVLITLSNDPYPEVQLLCQATMKKYFTTATEELKNETYDSLSDRMEKTLLAFPRVLNNIEMDKKVQSLNLLVGYIKILSGRTRLAAALSGGALRGALLEAARPRPAPRLLARCADTGITTSHSKPSPWLSLEHLEGAGEAALRAVCAELGGCGHGALLVDALLEPPDTPAALWLLARLGEAPNMDPEVTKLILNKFIEDSTWNLQFEVDSGPAPVDGETSTWEKDSVPGLYEGTIETRYTDISYQTPRGPRARAAACRLLAEAEANMLTACLLTEGVGVLAKKLANDFQPYLLKTLYLILERVGSEYEMLHLAGLQALLALAAASGRAGVADLIRHNADYVTYQVTTRLKKSWRSAAALRVLGVVLRHSDAAAAAALLPLLGDVLVQSCDKYHGNDLSAYLQVFITFVECIQNWYPEPETKEEPCKCCLVSLFKITEDFIKANEEVERLLDEDSQKSAVDMFIEDQKKKEEEALDYDDTVAKEQAPVPQHIDLVASLLQRCVHFISSRRRAERLLALRAAGAAARALRDWPELLLPRAHQLWAPLVPRFSEVNEPVVLRHAFELLATLAALAKDFLKPRTVKEVLPGLTALLRGAAQASRLQDAGSYYRHSPAYSLQVSILTSLSDLAADLSLEGAALQAVLRAAAPYLSNKQPKPLQALAIDFYRRLLYYDFGATWGFFRELCDNKYQVRPPALGGLGGPAGPARGGPAGLALATFTGSPFEPDPDYRHTVEKIFGL